MDCTSCNTYPTRPDRPHTFFAHAQDTCPSCEKPVIERDWYRIDGYHLRVDGACEYCGTPIAGRFGKFERPFGPRRIHVRLAAAI